MGCTADKTAFDRALGHLERDEAVRNPDHLARPLLADLPEARIPLRLAASSAALHSLARGCVELAAPGTYWQETARARYFDEVLLGEAARGVPQVVFLGAGLDSRSSRFAAELAGARVFEVDHPTTAARKRSRLTAALGGTPPQVAYVQADLSAGDLGETMVGAGLDTSEPVFVLWVGVSMYLSLEAVAGVLGWVGGFPTGSSIAFDYFHARFFERGSRLRGARRTRWATELSGERLTLGMEPETVVGLLDGAGLSLKSHHGPEEIADRYLRRQNGTLAGRPTEYASFAHAGVGR